MEDLRVKTRRRPYQRGPAFDVMNSAGVRHSEAILRTVVLVKRTRIAGKPRQQIVATLAGIDEVWLRRTETAGPAYDQQALSERIHFWHAVHRSLDRAVATGDITPHQRAAFDQQLSKLVPPPTELEVANAREQSEQYYEQWLTATPEQRKAAADELDELLAALAALTAPAPGQGTTISSVATLDEREQQQQ